MLLTEAGLSGISWKHKLMLPIGRTERVVTIRFTPGTNPLSSLGNDISQKIKPIDKFNERVDAIIEKSPDWIGVNN